jgi:hypothetical protein
VLARIRAQSRPACLGAAVVIEIQDDGATSFWITALSGMVFFGAAVQALRGLKREGARLKATRQDDLASVLPLRCL